MKKWREKEREAYPHHMNYICGSPVRKSNIISSRISSTSLSMAHYSTELPLRVDSYVLCKCINV